MLKIIKIILATCFILTINPNLIYSQFIDNKEPEIHSPRRATIYSTVFPGLGQAYNQKYWKIPIVYIGIGAFSYLAYDNHNMFNRFKNAYILRSDNQPDEFDGLLSEQGLLNEMDRYRKMRDYNIIGVTVIYVLQIIDANVDANLYDFDVSDDLSMSILPEIRQTGMFTYQATLGLKLVKSF